METENIKFILKQKPAFFVRWGMIILFSVLVLFVVYSRFIRYPQLAKGEIIQINSPVKAGANIFELDITVKSENNLLTGLSKGSSVNIKIKDESGNAEGEITGDVIELNREKSSEYFIKIIQSNNDHSKIFTVTPAGNKILYAEIIYFNKSLFDAVLFNFKIKK